MSLNPYMPTYRPIEEAQLVRYNIPRELWNVQKDQLPESIVDSVTAYCADLRRFTEAGVGFTFCGPPGTGKTGAAVYLLKQVCGHGKAGFFVTISQLREMSRYKAEYEGRMTVTEYCAEVAVLVLDCLEASDARGMYVDYPFLSGLLRKRVHERRPTHITTQLKPAELDEYFPSFYEILKGKNQSLPVLGPNKRDEAAKRLALRLAPKKTK